jgi:hypothetical protein
MLGAIVIFLIAAVAGYRRGAFDGKSIVAIAAISLFVVVIVIAGWAAFTPRAPSAGATLVVLAFLRYFLPLLAGYALGVIAKKQRLKNDAEDDGATN